MKFEINPENDNYIKARGKIVLNACPGSGKTSAVAYKLTLLLNELVKHYGKYSGIACLSFTNVAKDEIYTKFEKLSSQTLSYPNIVSTLDGFINKYLTLPFYHLLRYKSERPSILNSVDFLDSMNLGWFPNKRNQPLSVSYKPSLLKFEIDGTITWDGNQPNPAIVDPSVFERFAKKFKDWQLENGYLNNDDSSFIALQLLQNFPQIGKNLVARFPYLIIDEAQDTSELQYRIFDELIKNGLSNIEFIGDPYQSLYEFREARPDLFIQRYEDKINWKTYELSSCRRSSQKIIDFYQIFRRVSEKPIKSVCKIGTDLPVKIIKYNENTLDSLVSKYTLNIDTTLPYQILVRGSSHLEMFGVKQTYENPWKNEIAKAIILATYNFEIGKIKDCINTLRKIYVELNFPAKDYKEKLVEENKLKEDSALNVKLYDFIKNIPSTNDTLLNWTSKLTAYIKTFFGVEIELQLKKKGNAYVTQNLKTLMYPQTELQYPISTIHKVKGMTFNSILLVLSANSSGEKISISDFVSPVDLPNEKQRMIYVALSRPESFACIAVPNIVTDADIIAKFGNIEIVNV
ncbi:UvrD-helicase domain-containing protein [Sediminibacterium sp.]|uniref:UvrD-helicase domain-containing protein n=1 Tax=Sediminibacterium sp. TaxID=1917865 RepID=UPI003F6E74E1